MKVCITGASKGLGEALCRECIAAGHTVWGIARTGEPLRHMQQTLGNGSFHWSTVNIASDPDVLQWKHAMEERGFVPDILILNASIQIDDLTEDGYDHCKGQQTIDVNVSGALRCIGVLLPLMLQKKSGTIVAITSSVALRPSMRSAAYSASKAGIAMAMRSLRLIYTHRGVRLKTVCLGPIATTMWEGKNNFLVPSVERVAKAIVPFLTTRRSVLFYPPSSTLLLRLSLWLPDALFARISSSLMK